MPLKTVVLPLREVCTSFLNKDLIYIDHFIWDIFYFFALYFFYFFYFLLYNFFPTNTRNTGPDSQSVFFIFLFGSYSKSWHWLAVSFIIIFFFTRLILFLAASYSKYWQWLLVIFFHKHYACQHCHLFFRESYVCHHCLCLELFMLHSLHHSPIALIKSKLAASSLVSLTAQAQETNKSGKKKNTQKLHLYAQNFFFF